MKKKCEIGGCDRNSTHRGMCLKHYKRLWKGGDPHIPSRRDLSLEERFKAKLGPKDPGTGCVEWTGCRSKEGYGQIGRGRREEGILKAHRLAYELKYGPIPEGLCILHECDNPPCCNADHLFLGTRADNTADMVSKGRQRAAVGASNGNTKLTEAAVADIRRRISEGELQRNIVSRFGISQSSVSRLKLGKTWAHLK